ncbi:hypothetical protein SAMN02745225_00037 [Ferrithrix thermotolerans DSM 19514]|uniref:Secreted protein n=1 Tax=Ferrithrix thermotolerans DSM 19514 TaxID=1121881 RepID=A0A1M4S4R0_9ACTN|nr:hypothetical protein [Ferrithrix thermotolerans]SHE27204.1 hypothetical protein SAMN02745225_00037 [Ferrithrix thermotolerans DSM 19514]
MKILTTAKVAGATAALGTLALLVTPQVASAGVIFGGGSSGTLINVKEASIEPGGYSCDSSQWGFIINQLKGVTAPSYITVTWDYTNTIQIPLTNVTGSTAHYDTTMYLGETVTSATAFISPQWISGNGQFVLSHGPC